MPEEEEVSGSEALKSQTRVRAWTRMRNLDREELKVRSHQSGQRCRARDQLLRCNNRRGSEGDIGLKPVVHKYLLFEKLT